MAHERNEWLRLEVEKLVYENIFREVLLKCFLDAYEGYHQIQMAEADEDKTAFHTDSATYQRVVDLAFKDQIGRNLEAYVDDLVIKSNTEVQLLANILETFNSLRKINMKLNPTKCSFGKEEELRKEVQSLRGKLAALTRFLSNATELSLPFFQIQKFTKKTDFRWTEEVERAFFEMKSLLKELPTLTAPIAGGDVDAVSCDFKGGYQFRSRRRYGAAKYFQAHPIVVLTNQPIRHVLYKPEFSGRLYKWAIELGEHEINYTPRTTVKGQILADYLAGITGGVEALAESTTINYKKSQVWELYTDRACGPEGVGSGLVLTGPDEEEHTYAFQFTFFATNNESEYKALLSGMRIAQQFGIRHLDAYVDSHLVANQVNGSFRAHEASMKRYMELVHELANEFDVFRLTQVPRGQNKKSDVLRKLAALAFDHLRKVVWVEVLTEKSINEKSTVAPIEEESPDWMTPLVKFLFEGELPADKKEARMIHMKAPMCALIEGILYGKSHLGPSLLCLGPNQAKEVLREVHEGSCALHSGYRTIAAKVMRIGYYWPTIHSDAAETVRTCQSFQ
ncbi:uncharacterized protein [Rutidosis leptorrhynchoides]|uniref:uncharacterized protein n=1 Tax=Rutidosis leptorrhynchoides TaxID=125765 RepID=UPI003A992992